MDNIKLVLLTHSIVFGFLAAVSWFQGKRDGLVIHRLIFWLWMSILIAFPAQIFLDGNSFTISIGCGFGLLVSITLAKIGVHLSGVSPNKNFLIVMPGTLLLSGLFYLFEFDFVLVSFPIVIAVVLPMGMVAVRAIRDQWNTLSFSARGFFVSTLVLAIHQLDFIFFRPYAFASVIGYTVVVGIILVAAFFAFSADREMGEQKKYEEKIINILSHPKIQSAKLTPRETDVILQLLSNAANADIAANLVISVNTVKKHVCQVLAKLGVKNRQELLIQLLSQERQ